MWNISTLCACVFREVSVHVIFEQARVPSGMQQLYWRLFVMSCILDQLIAIPGALAQFHLCWRFSSSQIHISQCTVGTSAGTVPCAAVPLKVDLYFESEQRVEESDQSILNLLKSEYETYTLSPAEPTVTISFRLEKVSRRKDGQRFKLHVAPALDDMPADARKAVVDAAGSPAAAKHGVFTTAVVVMSKRRTGERFVSRPRPPRSVDADSTMGGMGTMGGLFGASSSADMLAGVPQQLHTLQNSVDNLLGFLHKLDARQSAMESALYSIVPRAPGASVGLPPTSMPPHSANSSNLWGAPHGRMHSGFDAFPSVPGMAQFSSLPGAPGGTTGLQGVSLGGLPGGNMGGLPAASAPQRAAGGPNTGSGIKRIRSKDLQFNFGDPSSSTPVGGAGGDGESTMPPPLPGQTLGGGSANGVPRMTSLDHMFSSMTQNSAMAVDERAAVEALAGASSSSAAAPAPAVSSGSGAGRGQQGTSNKRARR